MTSAQEVDVEMKYRLPRARTHIQHGPVSLLDVPLAGNLSRGQVTVAYHFSIVSLRFLQSNKMFLGDDQHMRRRLRVDVFKGEHMLVLVNLLSWNLAAEDAAEKAIARRIGHRLVTMFSRPAKKR
jgi:hypothetical protein